MKDKPSFLKASLLRFGCLFLFGSASLATLPAAGFTPEAPQVVLDFTALAPNDPVTGLSGWSGSNAIVGMAPRTPAQNPRAVVLTTTDPANQTVTSPLQTLAPPLPSDAAIYFSAWLNWSGSTSSNARITLENNDGISIGAFGLAAKQFGMADADGNWTYSDLTVTAHQWYELALVVDLQPDDLTASLGYLYIRPANSDATFEILPGFEDGILMGYGESLNATDFSRWRLQLRNQIQLDQLSVGVATIPEPGSVALLAGTLLLVLSGRFISRKDRKLAPYSASRP